MYQIISCLFMKISNLTLSGLMAACLTVCLCPPAFGMTLDTEGKADPKCTPIYHLETMTVERVRPKSIFYEFRGYLEYKSNSPSLACPPKTSSGSTVVRAQWDYPQVAAETAGHYQGEQFQTVTSSLSKCDYDPWLNQDAQCERIGSAAPKPDWPEPRPFTASLLTPYQRSQLLAQVESQLTPDLLMPKNNQTIKGTQLTVQAKVYLPPASPSHDSPEVEVTVKELLWPSPGGPTPMQKAFTLPVHNGFALKLIDLKHGNFEVKMRMKKPASQKWSDALVVHLVP
ncbi:hypothetical protein AAU61_20035 [Desulfocarbo indianensis]|nr:hypothetical protein AAU61_20035 [Desulfocarbo indianensis]